MISALHSIGMTNAMITSSGITIIIAVVAFIVSRNLDEMMPGTVQNMIEMGIEKLYNFFEDLMGQHLCKRYFPLVGTLFIYILICNYSGLLPLFGKADGLQAPTSSLNFTLGMAIVVIISVQIIGIRELKFKTFKRFVTPFAFVLPLMVMDEIVKPMSLSLRLYGNTFGDEQVVEVLSELIPVGLPVVMQFLIILLALIQALVFSLLTAIYIGEACESEEDEHL